MMLNAKKGVVGVVALVIIVLVIALVTYLQVEAMRQQFDEETGHWMEAEISEYQVNGRDVELTLDFWNVTSQATGHLEIRSEMLFVENRSVVECVPFAVQLVELSVDPGNYSRSVLVEDLVGEFEKYRVLIRYVGMDLGFGVTRVLDFEPVYIL